MALPTAVRVQSCMGCIPLRRGTITLGFLVMFDSLLGLFRWTIMLANFEQLVKKCQEDNVVNQSISYFHMKNYKIFGGHPHDDDDGGDDDNDNSIQLGPTQCPERKVALIVQFIMTLKTSGYFIDFILTALMIHGAKMGKPNFMVPWLWWQLANIALDILSLFGLGFGDFFTIFAIMLTMYSFLVVNSYYQQLREEDDCSADVTVVAVTHPREEMTVTIPSPRKDDPPPPYPSFTSVYNSSHNPSDSTGYPYAPPYTPSQNFPDNPPPYSASSPYQSAQVTQTIPVNQELYSSGNASTDPSDTGGEVAPLVDNSRGHITKPNQSCGM